MSSSGDLTNYNLSAFNLQNVYPHAFFDYLSRLLPHKLKTLFRWLEYLFVNCGQVQAIIKKYSEYPITNLTFETEGNDKQNSKKVEEIMVKHLIMKSSLIRVGHDYQIYGNSFTSLFKPFTRWLVCPKCQTKHNALNHPYTWMSKTFEFKIKCSNTKCQHHTTEVIAEVKHEKLNDPSKLKLVRWDPKQIDIECNPITGEAQYYYAIPDSIKHRIKNKKPDKFLINTLPWEFLQTIKEKKLFKFRPGQIYHMANPSPAGLNQEWGFPNLLGVLKPYFYTAILRKANEAISLERLVPWRVMHPQPSSQSNDPGQYVNLYRWKTELEDAIKKWRKDPNMIKLSPIPVGIAEVGSNSRMLLTHQELNLTEENMINTLGFPKEFVTGGLTHAGGSVTLRMLENMLFTYVEQMVGQAQWVADGVCEFCNLKKVTVDMIPFKLVDDIQQKQLVGQLYQQQRVSETSFLKMLDLNIEEERKLIKEETIARMKMEQELSKKQEKMQDNLATQVESSLTGNPLTYDPNSVMQMAEQEAMMALSLPDAERKDRLKQLEAQDMVMAILVREKMGDLHKRQREQGMYAMQQAQGGIPTPQGESALISGGAPTAPSGGF